MLVVKTLHFEGEIMPQAKVLDEKELKKVIQFIDAFDRHAERNRAIILLTHYCGMRISEVASLKTSQVINDEGLMNDIIYLSSSQTKGRQSRRVFVSTKAKLALKRYMTHKKAVVRQEFVFQTQKSERFNTNALTQLVKRIYQRVGVVGASSHSGRRSFITKLATSGVSVRVIAEAVGHSSITTTQRYIDINDNLVSSAVEVI